MVPVINCPKCGSNRFAYPPSLTDTSVITCDDCGEAVGTFADLREYVTREITDRSRRRR